MRLIDANELLHDIYECDEPMSHKYVAEVISQAPLVYCEYCKHWRQDIISRITGTDALCEKAGIRALSGYTPPGFGCSLFERRDDDPDR